MTATTGAGATEGRFASPEAPPRTAARAFLPYLFDIVVPYATYLVVHWLGAPAIWALTAGGFLAAASTAVNTLRRRGLDRVGALVIVEILISLALVVFVRDLRLMLIRPSFYTGAAAVYLTLTVLRGRPLSFDAAKPMAAAGGYERLAAYERAWERSAAFRATHRLVTSGFALALALDSLLRIVIAWTTPLERAVWLSNLPHTVALALIVAMSALAGRRFAALVDEELARERF